VLSDVILICSLHIWLMHALRDDDMEHGQMIPLTNENGTLRKFLDISGRPEKSVVEEKSWGVTKSAQGQPGVLTTLCQTLQLTL
jgi:hypothetical protein